MEMEERRSKWSKTDKQQRRSQSRGSMVPVATFAQILEGLGQW
jgi:hypothetical protein